MKKKLIIALGILAAIALGAYIAIKRMYANAERNVATEQAINIGASELAAAFSNNETTANTQYLNKTVAANGVVSSIDTLEAGSMQIHFAGVQALFKTPPVVAIGDTVSIKGICTGLVNEVNITESILLSNKKFVAQANHTTLVANDKKLPIDSLTKPNILTTNKAQITFDAGGGVEDIKATNLQVFASLSPDGKITFKAGILGFKFSDALMQQHFNEEYIESKKYPTAKFEGTTLKPIDITKDGSQEVTINGKLTLHGQSNNFATKAIFIVKGGKVKAEAQFNIALKDYKVKAAAADDAKITVKASF